MYANASKDTARKFRGLRCDLPLSLISVSLDDSTDDNSNDAGSATSTSMYVFVRGVN